MASIDRIRHERTPDGEQILIRPWETPEQRKAILNAMAAAGADEPVVRALAGAIAAPLAGASDRTVLQALLSGVFATVVYRPDTPSDIDFYQPAERTLRPVPGNERSPLTGQPKGTGDCEDTSLLFTSLVLAAAALTGRRLTGRVEWLSQPGKPQNHVAAVACDTADGCLWAETTLPGSRIGEHPYDALARLGMSERIEGQYLPTNSSGALHAVLPLVLLAADGVRLVVDRAPERGETVPAVAFPPSGAPFPATLTH